MTIAWSTEPSRINFCTKSKTRWKTGASRSCRLLTVPAEGLSCPGETAGSCHNRVGGSNRRNTAVGTVLLCLGARYGREVAFFEDEPVMQFVSCHYECQGP